MTEDQWDIAARNYRGKFGRMLVELSGSFNYASTTSLAADKVAAEPMIFSGSAIRIGGTLRIKQLIIFEKSYTLVTTPHKIPGKLFLFNCANPSDVVATVGTEFDLGSTIDYSKYAGVITVEETDYTVVKKNTEKVAIALVKDVNLDIQTYKDTRSLIGVFVTDDGMTTKSVHSDTTLYFKLCIQQD